MLRLKENEVCFVAQPAEREGFDLEGLLFRDTIYLDRYAWQIPDAIRLYSAASGNELTEYYSLLRPDRSEAVGLRRHLTVTEQGLMDEWVARNTGTDAQTLTLSLELSPRLEDMLGQRLGMKSEHMIDRSAHSNKVTYSRLGLDGVSRELVVEAEGMADNLKWSGDLDKGATKKFSVYVTLSEDEPTKQEQPELPSYQNWRESFDPLLAKSGYKPVLHRAIDDLRALLLRTKHGAYPAAGMPFFINFFGRDALITAFMLKRWKPELLRSVLLFLAGKQGAKHDAFAEEEPGKILHEMRRGELSRGGKIPFGCYYGAADSTPLFILAAGALKELGGHDDVIATIKPAVRRAVDWVLAKTERYPHFLYFQASGSGLTVQSWKDSPNSMPDEEGSDAKHPLAVSEVQGYCFAALRAAADLLDDGRNLQEAVLQRADALQQAFQERFWLPDLGIYALAIDGDGEPLRVRASDAGHLLWSGIVPRDTAPLLVETMMAEDMFSGWGIRTLAKSARAYKAVSYHNGSVWPHDTAIFAMGLRRYGFAVEADKLAHALLSLAECSPGRHMPEVISGFGRDEYQKPVAFIHANAPQAWSAAAVVLMAHHLAESAADHEV